MKALILIAAGLLSSGALAQSTMGNMSGQTTGAATHAMKKTTVSRSGTMTHKKMMTHSHRKAMHHHAKKPMHRHTAMHKKVTVETKTKM